MAMCFYCDCRNVCAPGKAAMYAETPTPVGYAGSLVPAQAYYGSQGYPTQQLREVDEISHRGERNYMSM